MKRTADTLFLAFGTLNIFLVIMTGFLLASQGNGNPENDYAADAFGSALIPMVVSAVAYFAERSLLRKNRPMNRTFYIVIIVGGILSALVYSVSAGIGDAGSFRIGLYSALIIALYVIIPVVLVLISTRARRETS